MGMSWTEIEQMCRRGAIEKDHFSEADWTDEKGAEAFFSQIDSFDKEQVRRFLDAQITNARPGVIASQYISKLEEETESVLIHKIFRCDDVGERDGITSLFERLFAVMTDIFRFPESLWEIGMSIDVPLEQLFLRLPFWKYERYGCIFHEFYDRADYEKLTRPVRQWKTVEDPRYDLIRIREKELEIQWSLFSVREEKERVFSETALCFYEQFFHESLLQMDDENLPVTLQHALRIHRASRGISL